MPPSSRKFHADYYCFNEVEVKGIATSLRQPCASYGGLPSAKQYDHRVQLASSQYTVVGGASRIPHKSGAQLPRRGGTVQSVRCVVRRLLLPWLARRSRCYPPPRQAAVVSSNLSEAHARPHARRVHARRVRGSEQPRACFSPSAIQPQQQSRRRTFGREIGNKSRFCWKCSTEF